MWNSGIPLVGSLVLLASTLAAAPVAAGAAPASSAPAAPAVAAGTTIRLAEGGGVRSASVPLSRLSSGVLRSGTFSMLALTWRGRAPRAEVRSRAVGGGWSPWRRVEPMHDQAEPGERGGSKVRGSDLMWTGPSERVQVRPTGARAAAPSGLRLVLINPGSRSSDRRPVAAAGERTTVAATGTARSATARAASQAPRPRMHSRNAWGANPNWRNGEPTFNTGLSQVHVHHTATGNGYARADVPGILRGMYRYHTKSLGWFDLGYNFLVDRFGRAWVGRSGGPSKPVRGAHTLGFNHNSTGIAVIGNFAETAPSAKSLRAVANIAAWKLDRHQRPRATGRVNVRSSGSDRYPAGRRVRLPVVDGHSDTNDTACPGALLHARLPWIRRTAQARMDRFS